MTAWESLAQWWQQEIDTDPMYREDITPLLCELAGPTNEGVVLDLGCGEGQVARALSGTIVGVDGSMTLLTTARQNNPVVRSYLPELAWVRDAAVAGAYAVMVLEHIEDLDRFFEETARVVAPSGWLVVVSNHPAYTAPGAGPIFDTSDGEYLWRWGPYFERSRSSEPAGDGVMVFHHRSLADVLTAAAVTGWSLTAMVERGASERAMKRDETMRGQQHFPRLVGYSWQRR